MTLDTLSKAVRDAYLVEYPFVCPECPPAGPATIVSPWSSLDPLAALYAEDLGVPLDGVADAYTSLLAAMNSAVAQNKKLITRRKNGNTAFLRLNTKLIVPSGLRIDARNTVFLNFAAQTGNSTEGTMLISFRDKQDIIWGGGDIDGRRPTTANEYQHGIGGNGCRDITVFDATTRNNNGDGIYIGTVSPLPHSTNVEFINCVAVNNARNNMSVIDCDGLYVGGSDFIGAVGTDPQAGCDIEPNNTTNHISDIVYESCTFANNTSGGFDVNLPAGASAVQGAITLRDCEITKNALGVVSWRDYGITLERCFIHDNAGQGFRNEAVNGSQGPLVFTDTRFEGNGGPSDVHIQGPLASMALNGCTIRERNRASHDGIRLNSAVTAGKVTLSTTRIMEIASTGQTINLNGAAASAVSGTPLP